MVIKTIAKRPWGDKIQSQSPTGQIYETGYEPFDEQEETDNCLRFVLSQDVTTAVTASDVRLVPKLLDAAERFKPLSDAEQKALTSTENLFFSRGSNYLWLVLVSRVYHSKILFENYNV